MQRCLVHLRHLNADEIANGIAFCACLFGAAPATSPEIGRC